MRGFRDSGVRGLKEPVVAEPAGSVAFVPEDAAPEDADSAASYMTVIERPKANSLEVRLEQARQAIASGRPDLALQAIEYAQGKLQSIPVEVEEAEKAVRVAKSLDGMDIKKLNDAMLEIPDDLRKSWADDVFPDIQWHEDHDANAPSSKWDLDDASVSFAFFRLMEQGAYYWRRLIREKALLEPEITNMRERVRQCQAKVDEMRPFIEHCARRIADLTGKKTFSYLGGKVSVRDPKKRKLFVVDEEAAKQWARDNLKDAIMQERKTLLMACVEEWFAKTGEVPDGMKYRTPDPTESVKWDL